MTSSLFGSIAWISLDAELVDVASPEEATAVQDIESAAIAEEKLEWKNNQKTWRCPLCPAFDDTDDSQDVFYFTKSDAEAHARAK